MGAEDKIFLAIKNAVEPLDAKTVKVYLDGKDSMLRGSIKRDHPNFSIEGKEVVFSYETENLEYYDNYFSGYGVLADTPYLQERWGKRREGFLDEFHPSDIKKITYGRKTVYTRA